MPEARELTGRYDESYLSYELANEDAFFHLMQLTLEDFGFFPLAEERGFGKGKFLDVGCATGRLLLHLKDLGWKVQGVEVCRPAADYGRLHRDLAIATLPLEQCSFGAHSFDVVHASHLIEHLEDPRSFLGEVHRILSPRGLLMLTTPNEASLQARVMGKKWRSLIEDHVHLFSARNLGRLLEEQGFTILKQVTWGGIPQGMAPGPVKKAVDTLAKTLGFGDVVAFLARPGSSQVSSTA